MNTYLWTSDQIAAATSAAHSDAFRARGVSINTRTLQSGDLFIALPGENFDGHDFIDEAMSAGAAGILSSKPLKVPHVLVKDTMQGLNDLARAARARFKGSVIAITGSVGKTSTKDLTAAAFGSTYKVHATCGNLNNLIGTPLTLASMPQDSEIAVIEMGMNQFGELALLSRLTQPTKAIITAIDWVHSENLGGTLEGVAKAKCEICEGLNGPLFAPVHIRDILTPYLIDQSVTWVESPYKGRLKFTSPEHHWNAALALATVPADQQELARSSMADVAPSTGRGREEILVFEGKTIHLIDDSYNAAPASMRVALEQLSRYEGGRKVAVVGDMAELANPATHHTALGQLMAELSLDLVLAVGRFHPHILTPLPTTTQKQGLASSLDVLPALSPQLRDKDMVLVKASNSTGLSRVVHDLRAAAESP